MYVRTCRFRRFRQSRRGLTLVEMIFLIALIAVVFLILSRLTLMDRSRSQSSGCMDHMRQIAYAAMSYEQREGYFPPGMNWSVFPGSIADERSLVTGAGPLVAMLNDLGESGHYNALNFDWPIHSPANTTVCSQRISTFQCPADSGITIDAQVDDRSFPGVRSAGKHAISKTSYAAVAGPWVANTWKIRGMNQGERSSFSEVSRNQLGMFNVHSRVRLADVSDGMSQTLLFGERSTAYLPESSLNESFWWFSGNHGDSLMSTMFPILSADRSYPPEIAAISASSNHTQGVVFAFADGSARIIRPATAGRIEAAPVPNGGMPHLQGWMSPAVEIRSVGPDPFWDTLFRLRSGAAFSVYQKLSTRSASDPVDEAEF